MSSLLRIKRLVWALALALASAVMLYAYVTGRQYVAAVADVEHTLEVSRAIEDVLSTVTDQETGQRGYLLTGDDEYLDAFFVAQKALPEKLHELRGLTRDNPAQQSRIGELEELALEKHAFMSRTIGLKTDGREEQLLVLLRGRKGKLTMDRIRAVGDVLQAEERRLLAARSATAARTQERTVAAIGFGSLLILLLLLGSFVTVHRDFEEVRRTAEELAESEERFRLLAENATDLVRLHRPDGTHLYVSPSVERLLGYSPAEALALPATAFLHPEETSVFQELLSGADAKRKRGSVVHRMRHKDGSYRWFETLAASTRHANGSVRHLQTTGRDVTDRRRAEEQLELHAAELKALSLRDALTGLYNRRGVLELGQQLLRLAERGERVACLLFVDLDGLKRINDEFGHEAGDQAIREAGEVLSSTCRAADIVARLGGDELVVLAADVDERSVQTLKSRIERTLQERNQSGRYAFVLSFSMGFAFFDPRRPEPLDAMLARADAEMYGQKRARRCAALAGGPAQQAGT